MNLKQQVDKYLLENYETINVAKETPTFRWKEVADKIEKEFAEFKVNFIQKLENDLNISS
jgi:hypothetical protein